MRYRQNVAHAGVLVAVLTGICAGNATTPTRVWGVSRPTAPAGCSALGTYYIGPRFISYRVGPPRLGVAPIGTRQGRDVALVVRPIGVLRGALVVLSYGGCDAASGRGPTAGTFSARRVPIGPPILQPERRPSIVCPDAPCGPPLAGALGVIGLDGRFAQDATHPHEAARVAITGTVTMARLGPQPGRPCSTRTSCPAATVVTSTIALTGTIGALKVASQGQAATLSFPMPVSAMRATSPLTMTLYGTRSRGGAPHD